MLIEKLPWLPPHTFRPRKGARHVRFSIDGSGFLTITVPMTLSEKRVLAAVTERRAWIEKHSCYTAPADHTHYYPLYLSLKAFNENWRVHYIPTHQKRLIFTEKQEQTALFFQGPIHAIASCQLKLGHWIRQRATLLLTSTLNKLSQETGLAYGNLQIRRQQSRWGSCSSKKNISLNDKLLFLPYPWLRYVCIHELCHTQQMDHSQKFWQLVAQHDPNYLAHKRGLRKAGDYIPKWL